MTYGIDSVEKYLTHKYLNDKIDINSRTVAICFVRLDDSLRIEDENPGPPLKYSLVVKGCCFFLEIAKGWSK